MRTSPIAGTVMGSSDGRSHRSYIGATKRLRAEAPSVCWRCGIAIDQGLHHNDPMAWTADHVIPVSECQAKGIDPNGIDNLRPAHRSCNCSAGAKLRQGKSSTTIDVVRTRIWH